MAGIYVHVPFCHAKCAYCDFYSIARTGQAEAYVRALLDEHRQRLDENGGLPVNTLYLGGGTPSLLDAQHVESIARRMLTADTAEFTIEVNPEDVSPDKVRSWKDAGVNRVSMGVQSLVDDELKAIRRRHSARQALEAVETIQAAGIDNISLDLIYGLPGQTSESFISSAEGCVAAGARHLSAYLLSYEPGTLLSRRLAQGLVSEASDELVEDMYGRLCSLLAAAGYHHYEISNFALPGFESRHNSSYWDLTPYLGLGPSAHSLGADGVRRYHQADLRAYLTDPVQTVEESEDDEEKIDDLIIISLRRASGLDTDRIPEPYRSRLLESAAPHLAQGTLVAEGKIIKIPERHWLRADAVMRDLLVC